MLPTPAMNPSQRQLSRYGWRPADPPRRPVLFVNPGSGDGKAARAGLAERAREKEIEAVILAPGQDLDALARQAVAAGADALGMAGGDGSLAVVAAVAAAHSIPFVCVPVVCVPAGTRNHFALDVGMGRHDVIGALDAFTDGVERQIDMAEVNGRAFLNNASLGDLRRHGPQPGLPRCQGAYLPGDRGRGDGSKHGGACPVPGRRLRTRAP
jgi:hypothetical protein